MRRSHNNIVGRPCQSFSQQGLHGCGTIVLYAQVCRHQMLESAVIQGACNFGSVAVGQVPMQASHPAL